MFSLEKFKKTVRIIGRVEEVSSSEADEYYKSRPYKNKIGAWASSQSEKLEKRNFLEKIKEFENKYKDESRYPGLRIGLDGGCYQVR